MPENLFEGDPRMETLMEALSNVMFERGKGLPIPSILGVLRLLEEVVINNAKD